MGTKIFITEEDKAQNRRRELEVKAASLWATYADEYKILPIDYFFCLQEKEKRRMKLHKLPIAVKDYPNLPLLRIMRYDELDKFLRRLTMDELISVVNTTQYAVDHDYVLCSLREWIKEAKYLIQRADESSLATPPTIADAIATPWN